MLRLREPLRDVGDHEIVTIGIVPLTLPDSQAEPAIAADDLDPLKAKRMTEHEDD